MLPQNVMNGCPACAEAEKRVRKAKWARKSRQPIDMGRKGEAQFVHYSPSRKEMLVCDDTSCRPMTREEKVAYLRARKRR